MLALNSVGPSWHHDCIRSSTVAWLCPSHCAEGGRITPSVSLCEENEFSKRNLNSSNNLKKPQLPECHFDAPEDSNLEKVPLTKFPDYVNPVNQRKRWTWGPRTYPIWSLEMKRMLYWFLSHILLTSWQVSWQLSNIEIKFGGMKTFMVFISTKH